MKNDNQKTLNLVLCSEKKWLFGRSRRRKRFERQGVRKIYFNSSGCFTIILL